MPLITGNIYSPRAALMPNLRGEVVRLKTFNNWPSTIMTPGELASSGFYYTGFEDVARCVFCCAAIGDWEEGDRASVNHERFSPDCDFIKGRPCGNVPETSTRRVLFFLDDQQFRCGSFVLTEIGEDSDELKKELRTLGVNPTVGPRRPYLASIGARLHTFRNMLTYLPIPAKSLAAAGFYSAGYNETYCFHCGGGLLDWAPNDDPWFEHARFYPQCTFVNMVKGRDFVMRARLIKAPILNEKLANILALLAEEGEAVDLPLQMGTMWSDESDEDLAPDIQVRSAERCMVCMRQERSIVFVPCRHLVTCGKCASGLSWCPLCKEQINGTVRVYF